MNDLVHNLLIFIFFIIIQQLESRDNEISRLHKQLTGGRPVAALGRDCCYRGIDTLTEDMKLLQQQLIATKKELKESLEQQHEAKLRAIKLDEEKKKYAKDLKQMEEFALRFQDEANEKLLDKEKDYEHLVVRIRKNFFFFFLFLLQVIATIRTNSMNRYAKLLLLNLLVEALAQRHNNRKLLII